MLSHAHNAEANVELREDIGAEGAAVGEDDSVSTHPQLLAQKRIGFLLLTGGLALYLTALIIKSPKALAIMAPVGVGAVLARILLSAVFTRTAERRMESRTRRA